VILNLSWRYVVPCHVHVSMECDLWYLGFELWLAKNSNNMELLAVESGWWLENRMDVVRINE
jgi:hypothetical protein